MIMNSDTNTNNNNCINIIENEYKRDKIMNNNTNIIMNATTCSGFLQRPQQRGERERARSNVAAIRI